MQFYSNNFSHFSTASLGERKKKFDCAIITYLIDIHLIKIFQPKNKEYCSFVDTFERRNINVDIIEQIKREKKIFKIV